MRRAKIVALFLVCITVIASAAAAQFQRRGGRFGFGQIRPNPSYDGAWMFCRIMFRNASNGDGGGWPSITRARTRICRSGSRS